MQTSRFRVASLVIVLSLTSVFASRTLTAVAPGFSPANSVQVAGKRGILLLAHGGKPEWNSRVTELASHVAAELPTEVAFGMASRPNIQSAVDRLVSTGVTEIVAVPLFVSSHSSVVTSTEYLLGVREDMPPELKIFAKMNHGAHGGGSASANNHAEHAATVDPTTPIKSPAKIRMTAALDRHQLVGDILASRALALSRTPAAEAVVLVAHGPVLDAENKLWLDDMAVLAERVRASAPFASVDSLTVRDDAPKPIRDVATEELRALVTKRTNEQRRVLIVPLLLSYGGIEDGIRKRLEGLDVAMADRALMPDDRLTEWVLTMAR